MGLKLQNRVGPLDLLSGLIPLFINRVFFGLLLSFFLVGCVSKKKDPDTDLVIHRGRTIYRTHCTACHNSDPSKAGAIGPEIQGASKELLEARLLKGAYPPGYKPKRPTRSMTSFPYLKDEIEPLR